MLEKSQVAGFQLKFYNSIIKSQFLVVQSNHYRTNIEFYTKFFIQNKNRSIFTNIIIKYGKPESIIWRTSNGTLIKILYQ